ncbi:DUF3311 domain-containing protein [Tumebacillus sp. ITR2]|uniref:DUF3311 domain-containing protein n=1 Tax=Tumebacillus amylolyticus TaxID=2801339 RepID=A0ABS1J4F5_9BACL|nr:DUF3311 domain-containing protein [Tumebacillus amylolyticus]MBL0385158.1 DUF3311 domain-containing protein [Tumebacillus amylolyticus]
MNKISPKILIASLALLPFVAQLLVLPWVNRIDPVILGLPFLQFWLFLWIVLSPLCTYSIYRIQKAQGRFEG